MWIVNKVMYGLIIMVLVCLLTGSLQQFAQGRKPEAPLFAALNSTGGKVQQVSINAWGQLPNGNFTVQELKELAVCAIKQLGVREDAYTITKTGDAQRQSIRAEVVEGNMHITALVQTIKVLPASDVAGYIVLNLESNNCNDKELTEWQQELKNIIKEFGCLPHINTCLTGWLDGKLLKEEWGICLENAFQAAKATTMDRMEYSNLVSLSGYSPAIADYVQYGTKKVNVNIAMRYSPHDNRTYIIVGSPVITREY